MKFECDDSSSGYSSVNDSDNISVMSYDSVTSCVTSSSVDSLYPPQTIFYLESQFPSAHALCEDMKIILAIPEMCDVTFLVGPRAVPVHGLKAVLASRSRFTKFLLNDVTYYGMKRQFEDFTANQNMTSSKFTEADMNVCEFL